MGVVRRSVSTSGIWLLRRVMKLAQSMARGGVVGGTKKQIIEGYLLIAKKSGQAMSAVVMDLPAYLCLPGRYYDAGSADIERAYVQQLYPGRDTYLPGGVTHIIAPQTNPLLMALVWNEIDFGQPFSGNRLATRLWGVAQPFSGTGCMYGYGAVYLTSPDDRLALGNALPSDPFAYRLAVFTPTYVRSESVNGAETVIPENPTAAPTGWTLQIPESLISNAKSFIRLDIDRSLITPENDNIITFWDVVQYPWIGFSAPRQFFDDDGNVGYRVHVCAQVVYEEGGPYEVDPEAVFYPFAENSQIPAAGARGLWFAQIQVLKGEASIINQAGHNGLNDDDPRRQPWSRTFVNPNEGIAYEGNVAYKATPVTLNDGTMIVAASSFVTRKAGGSESEPPIPDEEGYWLFCDVFRMSEGGLSRENISTTKVTRILSRFPEGDTEYAGGVAMFDAGLDENRCVIGTATDGVVAISLVFSAFRPGDVPKLTAIASTNDSSIVTYSGTPGFSMMMGSGGDETVSVGYVEAPENPDEQRFWAWMTSDNQVAYLGNGKYCFYCSSEWSLPPDGATSFVTSGNLALAVYNHTDRSVQGVGVIDPALSSSGTTASSALTQLYLGSRLGNIEVLRKESDGYNRDEGIGNPATLIVTRGKGAAAITLDSQEGQDITYGQTWISYDSGETWVQMLDYGSPVGAFHCGNIAQARSEPVVRV